MIDEGGLEIMSAVGVQRHNLTHHARRLLKRKEKVSCVCVCVYVCACVCVCVFECACVCASVLVSV